MTIRKATMKYNRLASRFAILLIVLSLFMGGGYATFSFSTFLMTDTNMGATSSYIFGLTPSLTLDHVEVVITFPIEYTISEFAAEAQCYYSKSGIPDQYLPSTTCIVEPDSVTNSLYLLGSISTSIPTISPAAPTYVAIKKIINPDLKVSSFFTVCIRKNGVLLECNKQFGRAVFTQNPVATISGQSIIVEPTAYVGQGSSYTLKGTLSSLYSSYALNELKVRVKFPEQFGSDGPLCSIAKYFPNGTAGAYQQTTTTILPATPWQMDCSVSSLSNYLGPNKQIMIKIENMINPIGAGLYNNIKLQVLYNPHKQPLQELSFTSSVQILTQILDVTVKQSDYMRNSTNVYYFMLNHETILAEGSSISFQFPLTGWTLYSAFPVIGFTSPETLHFEIDNNLITIDQYGVASNTQQQIIGINLTSNAVSGTYPVQVTTHIDQQLIGQWQGSVYLNATIGSMNLLSISSVKKEVKLPVDSTGPLEMRFFLNYELPPSEDVENGTLELSIFPKIPKPDPDTKGAVKCFWAGYYEGNCTYDDSLPDRTIVTVTSPPHDAYKYSEIPLIITTEGGTDTDNLGLTIDPLVQRYRFQAEFFLYNSSVVPSEVFYTTWIADAIQLTPITVLAVTHECEEYTHLQIDMNMPLLASSLAKQFRIMVQFLNADDSAWAHSLGYDFDKIYQRYPCVVTGLTGDNIFCDLYTYYERKTPYSNLHINTDTTGPYFIIYGFDQNIALNDPVQIHLPKIKIGNTVGADAMLGISILEETPGEKEPYVELYYYDMVAFTTIPPISLVHQPVPSSESSIMIQTLNQYDISWTVNTPADVAYIIYELTPEELPSLDNEYSVCLNSQCSGFGLPANHIFETPASVSPTHLMQTLVDYVRSMDYLPDVQSDLPIRIRTFDAVGSTLDKYEMNINYIAFPITVSAFTFMETTIYGGLEQLYSVSFDNTDTLVSEYPFMRFILADGLSFVDPPQCSSTTVLPFNESGLICTRQDAQTMRVHNIQQLAALGSFQINFKMQTTQTTPFPIGQTISPIIDIQVNHNNSVDSSIVAVKQDQLLTQAPVNPLLAPPQKFLIHNPQIINENTKVDYIGPLYVQFQSTSSGVFDITLTLNSHQYNGGRWTTPKINDLDPLVCFMNEVRFVCNPTHQAVPQALIIDMMQVSVQTGLNELRVDTQYIFPYNGIQFPSEAGMYLLQMALDDGTTASQMTFYAQMHAPDFLHLLAGTICKDIGRESVYKFNFTVETSINAYSDSTLYSRITIEFPTRIGTQPVFDWNLGGYEGKVHERVGCYFHVGAAYVLPEVGQTLKCKLLPSLKDGQPARVEIVNQDAFTSAQILSVYVFKVYNPDLPFSSVPLTVRIDHIDATNGYVYPIHQQQYRVFLDPYSQIPITITPSQSLPNDPFFKPATDVGDIGHVEMVAHRISTGGIYTDPFYMIVKFPQYFSLFDNQLGELTDDFCPLSGFQECISVPEINYFLVKSIYEPNAFKPRVLYPLGISQDDSFFYSNIIEDGRFTGIVEHTISQSTRWPQILGTITLVECKAAGIPDKAVKGKTQFEIMINMIVTNLIPETGSIEIGFPTTITNVQPHCRSSITSAGATFDLVGKAGTTGEVGCAVQNTNKWVITGFQEIPAGSTILIKGVVDLPSVSGSIGAGHITTYADTNLVDINDNGSRIDHLDITDFQLQVVDTFAMNIDEDVFMTQRSVIRAGYVGEYRVIINSDRTIKTTDKITLMLRKNDIKNQAVGLGDGFALNPGKEVCEFVRLDTGQQIGCRVDSETESAVVGQESISYVVRPTRQSLLLNIQYEIRLTTQKYSEPATHQGITYPTQPGTYKTQTIIKVDNVDKTQHRYIQIYGTEFLDLKVTQYNYLPGEYNLIWVELTPTTTITIDQQIILEFPTLSNDGSTAMFDDNLGLNEYSDGDRVPVDMFDTGLTDENQFMECRLYHGDQTRGIPVRLVCGHLKSALTTASLFKFAFGFTNPPQVVAPNAPQQLSLPIMVYSYDPFYFKKTNFNLVNSAVLVLFTYNIATYLSPNGHFRTTSNQYQFPDDELLFGDAHTYDLVADEDSFVLKFNFPLRINGKKPAFCLSSTDVVIGDAYYHERLRTIVCKLNQGITLGVDQAPADVKVKIAGFYTPWYRLADSQRKVYGIATYHSTSLSEVIDYNDMFPHLQPKYDFNGLLTTPQILTEIKVEPVHGHNVVCQTDDYIFQVTLHPSSTVTDLEYCRMISIHFPENTVADYFTMNTDCVQYVGSEIEVIRCDIDFTPRALYIQIVPGTYENGKTIKVKTKDMAIGNPCSVFSPVDVNQFTVFFYSWENITTADTRLMQYAYMTMDVRNIIPSSIVYTQEEHPVGTLRSHHPFSWIHTPHERYFQQFPQFKTGQYSPFSFQIMFTATNPPPAAGGLHKLIIYYGSEYSPNIYGTDKDLEYNKPVCYLHNNRIQRCTIDTTNNKMEMQFSFLDVLPTGRPIHVYFSVDDPRKPHMSGFYYKGTNSDLNRVRVDLQHSSGTVYHFETEPFPGKQTQTGTVLPERAINYAIIDWGSNIAGELNVIEMEFDMSRNDVTGLQFLIPLVNEINVPIYAGNAATAFFEIQNGGRYPCGNNDDSNAATGNPKCYIYNGDNANMGYPTVITMVDFVYTSKIKVRLLLYNPDSTTTYFSIRVKAFTGTADHSSTFGHKYVGYWNFFNLFMPVAGAYSLGAILNDGTTNQLQPQSSLWRETTTWNLLGTSPSGPMSALAAGLGGYVILQVPIYDSSKTAFTDRNFCQIDFSSGDANSNDMLIIDSKQKGYKRGYFIKKWVSSPWIINYFKCKHYGMQFRAFYMIDQITTSETTHSFTANIYHPHIFDQAVINYYDIIGNRAILQMDLTTIMGTINVAPSLFTWDDYIPYQLLTNIIFAVMPYTGTPACYVTGGFYSSEGKKPLCQMLSTTQFLISDFNGLVKSNVNGSYILKIEFDFSSITVFTLGGTNTIDYQTILYANNDARINGLEWIFSTDVIVPYSRTFVHPNADYVNYAICAYLDTLYYSYHTETTNQMRTTISKFQYNPGNSQLDVNLRIQPNIGSTLHGLITNEFSYQVYSFYVEGFDYACDLTTPTISAQAKYYSATTGVTYTIPATGLACVANGFTLTPGINMVPQTWNNLNTFIQNSYLDISVSLKIVPTYAEEPYMRDWIGIRSSLYGHSYSDQTTCGTPTYGSCSGCCGNCLGCGCGTTYVTQYYYQDVDYVDWSTTHDLRIATSMALQPLTKNANVATELSIDFPQIYKNIGSLTTGKILLIQLFSSSLSSTVFPFTYINNTISDVVEYEIQCQCISSWSASSAEPALCHFRRSHSNFANHAITVDIDVVAGHSLQCYFPEFLHPVGTLSAVAKLINDGSSFPPHVNNINMYGGFWDVTSPTISFTTNAIDTNNLLQVTENTPVYSAASIQYVNTQYQSSYQLILTTSSALTYPKVYIDFQKSGFIPDKSICNSAAQFTYCRVYNTLQSIIVAEFQTSTAVNVFKFVNSSSFLEFPKHQEPETLANTEYDILVRMKVISADYFDYQDVLDRQMNWLLPSDIDFFVEPEIGVGSSYNTFDTNIILNFELMGHLIYPNYNTGAIIVITQNAGVLGAGPRGCSAISINNPLVDLDCVVQNNRIQVTNQDYHYEHTDAGLIQVIVGINNPATNILWTINGYQFYKSASDYGLQFTKTVTYVVTDYPGIQQERSQMRMLPFVTRIYSTDYTPFRVAFRLSDVPPELPDDLDYPTYSMIFSGFELVDAPIDFSNFQCTFKEYTKENTDRVNAPLENSYRNWKQNLQYIPHYAYCEQINATTISIEMPRLKPLNIDFYYELVIMPTGTVLPQTGFDNLADDQFRILTIPDSCQYIGPWQLYYGHSFSLASIYLVTERPSVDTALQIKFKMNFASSVSYPEHYFEIHFRDLNMDAIKPAYKFLGGKVPCTLSAEFVSAGRTNDPFCVVNYVHELHGDLVLRVLELGPLPMLPTPSYYRLALDDFYLPMGNYNQKSNIFTVCMRFLSETVAPVLPDYFYFERCFGEIFVIDGQFNTTAMGVQTGTFANPTTSTYGYTVSGTLTHTYPLVTSAVPTVSQKAMARISGGYSATSPAPLGFSGYTILWYNQELNLYILKQPASKALNAASSITVTTLTNPQPYQKEQYEFINTIEMTYYDQYHPVTQINYNQPPYTYFTLLNPPLVFLANSYLNDIRTQIPTDTPSIAVLKVNILESIADLTTKLDDKLEIVFDAADVSAIEDCWVATVTAPTSYSKDYRCQSTSNNKIILYNFYNANVNNNLTVYVQLRTISTNVDMVCTLYSDNGQIQYTSTNQFTTISSKINLASTKFPLLSFTENFYTHYYFEQAILPMTITTETEYLYFSMYLPADLVQITTFFTITLPATVLPMNVLEPQQICEWLKVDRYGRKYITGVYSHCQFLAGILTVQSPFGGLPANDAGGNRIPYLLKVRELDIIKTSYQMPANSQPEQIIFQFNNNGNLEYDTLIFHPYEHFSGLKFLPYTLNIDQLNSYHIQFTPATTITGIDTILQLSIDTRYMPDDLGMEDLFANYGIDVENQTRIDFNNYNIVHDIIGNKWINGDPYSCYTSNKLLGTYSAKQTSVHMSTINSHKLRITHLLEPTYTAATQFIWKIPLLLNPSVLQTPFRMNLTLYTYQAGFDFPQKELFYQLINEYFTTTNSPSSLTYSIKKQNSIQSTTAELGIQVTPAIDSPTSTDVVELKFNNQVAGLIDIPDFMLYTENNPLFDFYFFPRINMMLGHKKFTDNIQLVELGATEVTNNYADYIGYDWVKYHSRTSITTTKQAGPSHKILSHCILSSSLVFQEVEGISWITSSEFLLQWQFKNVNCMIPLHSTMVINFASTNLYEPILDSPCYISFRESSCLPSPRGIEITFHEEILANTVTTTVKFYVRTIGMPSTSITLTGFIFGIPGEQFTKVIEFTNIGQLDVTTNNIVDVPMFEHIMIRNLYENTQMDIRGTIIPRIGYTDATLRYPFPADIVTATQRMILRRNSTSPYLFDFQSDLDWQQKFQEIISANEADYTVPSNGLEDYIIYDNTEHTFILETTYEVSGLLNDFTVGPVGSYYQFQYQTISEIAYEQVYPVPVAQELIVINPITEINQETALGLKFIVSAHDVNPGDRITIQLDTVNLMWDMFMKSSDYAIECVERVKGILSDEPQLVCEPTQQPDLMNPEQALIITVYPKKTVALGTTIEIWLSPIFNPPVDQMVSGVIVRVDTECINGQGQQRCQIYEARGYYRTNAALTNVFSTGVFTPSLTQVLLEGVDHVFDIDLKPDYSTFFAKYPINYQDVMPLQCVSGSVCLVFPQQRRVLTMFDPPVSTAQLTLSNMNNGIYLQPESNDVDLVGITSGQLIFFDILHQNLTTRQQIPRLPADTWMTITPTQTPNYFLRNYMNTATIEIYGLYSTTFVNCFYINAPQEIVTWDTTYCNATIYSPLTDTYPTRLLCSYINDTTIQILIPEGVQQNYVLDVTDEYIMTVHAKFFIEDFAPGDGVLYVTPPVDSGTFNAYGSYSVDNHSYPYYITEASTVIEISEHRVPILGDANFNTESFTERLANVNQSTTFELLIDPTTTDTISRMQIIIPEEFNYPPTGEHNACQLISTFTNELTKCYQIRRDNKTILSVQFDSSIVYDNGPRILKLGSQDEDMWFTAPEEPGSWYNFTVLLYGTNGELLQAQTTKNSSNIGGLDLSLPDIHVVNGRDAEMNEIVDIEFTTGALDIRRGYSDGLSTGQKYTEIRIGFENMVGYAQDLGLGIADEGYAGCVLKQVNYNREITCSLDIGYDFNDEPYIVITGYQEIMPYTTVTISLSNLLNLPSNLRNTVSISVILKKVGDDRQAFLYNPTKKILLSTSPLATVAPSVLDIQYTGPKTVGMPTTLQINLTPNIDINSYIVLKFPFDGINNEYKLFEPVTCSNAEVDIFYRSDVVRIYPTSIHNANQPDTYIIENFPTPQFSIGLSQWNITFEAYKDLKQVNSQIFTISGFQISACKLSFGLLTSSSPYTFDTGVEYLFEFVINSTNLAENELTVGIQFPAEYGDLRLSSIECIMDSNATCRISRSNAIQIMNVRETNQLRHKILLKGIKNPETLSNLFIASSYIGQDVDNIICQGVDTVILLESLPQTCQMQATSSHHTQNLPAIYSFNIQCDNIFRNQSEMLVKIPTAYIYQNQPSINCWATQRQNLLTPDCTLEYINGSYYLKATDIMIEKNQIQFELNAQITNPALTGAYQFEAQLSSNNFTYATTNTYNLSVYAGVPTQMKSVQIVNLPKQSGIQSVYFIRIPTATINESLQINFPPEFDLPDNVQVQKFVSNSSTWAQSLNYQDMQTLSGVTLSSSIGINDNLQEGLFIENTDTPTATNGSWTYFMLTSITNPAYQSQQPFTLSAYSSVTSDPTQKLMTSTTTQPFNYSLNPPAEDVHHVNITVTDNDILQLANYTLTYKLQSELKTNLTQFFITPPYAGAIYAMTALQCCLVVNASYTYCNSCTIFEGSFEFNIEQSDIIIPAEQKFDIKIGPLYNPPNATDCTKLEDFEISYFDLQILKNNKDTLFKSSMPTVMDGKPCQKYRTLRGDILPDFPDVLYAGLYYNFTIRLSEPTKQLEIRLNCTDSSVTFEPEKLYFPDYQTTEVSGRIAVSAMALDNPEAYINITHFQGGLFDLFRPNLPHRVKIISSGYEAYVTIENIKAESVGYYISVPINLSVPSSVDLNLQLEPQTADSDLVFEDLSITIPAGSSTGTIKFKYTGNTVPPTVKIPLSLNSQYPFSHILDPEDIYLYFSVTDKYQTLPPVMQVQVMDYYRNNSDFVGQTIYNALNSSYLKYDFLLPNITSHVDNFVGSTSADILIHTREECSVAYVVREWGDHITGKPSSPVQLINLPDAVHFKTYKNSTMLVNPYNYLNLTKLEQQTTYYIYMAAYSTMGSSVDIKTHIITTGILSAATKFNLITREVLTDEVDIVKKLSDILMIDPTRIKVVSSEKIVSETYKMDSNTNEPYYTQEIVISPSIYDDRVPPIDIVMDRLIQSQFGRERLQELIPSWIGKFNVKDVRQLHVVKPRPSELPKAVRISYYNATFSARYWESTEVHAILIETEIKSEDSLKYTKQKIIGRKVTPSSSEPSSKQIIKGLNASNKKAKQHFWTVSPSTGEAVILFTKLKPGTKYIVYITGKSAQPFEPVLYGDNSQVTKIEFYTLWNPNLRNKQKLILDELKTIDPQMHEAITSFYQNQEIKQKKDKLNRQ